MKESGKTANFMAKDLKVCQMVQSLMVSGVREDLMDRACVSIQMELNILEVGPTASLMVLE